VVALTVLLASNLALMMISQHRTYPLTRIGGINLGGLDRSQLAAKMASLNADYKLELRAAGERESLGAAELGADFQSEGSLNSLIEHAWYDWPMERLWNGAAHWRPAVDDGLLAQAVAGFANRHSATPSNASVTLEQGVFTASGGKPGLVVDAGASVGSVKKALLRAAPWVSLRSHMQKATISLSDAEKAAKAANAVRALQLKVSYGDKTYAVEPATIAGWVKFGPSLDGKSLVVQIDKAKVADYLALISQSINVEPVIRVLKVQNGQTTQVTAGKNGLAVDQDAAVTALAEAAEKRESRTVALSVKTVPFDTTTLTAAAPNTGITYRYCVGLKGVDGGLRAGFATEVARVYADARGWGLGGKIRFMQVDSGCAYTVWLAAANLVPGFAPDVCSSYYSCSVGPNVIINLDRWLGATTSWTLGLTDYHSMVVNHETGHWLGFNHLFCPGPGQLAPVMQQQSISLQGCQANPWPTGSERQTVAAARGL
jgi:vancomycin resistance protein YoaR